MCFQTILHASAHFIPVFNSPFTVFGLFQHFQTVLDHFVLISFYLFLCLIHKRSIAVQLLLVEQDINLVLIIELGTKRKGPGTRTCHAARWPSAKQVSYSVLQVQLHNIVYYSQTELVILFYNFGPDTTL